MKAFTDNNRRFFIFLLSSLFLQILLFELGDIKAGKQIPKSEIRKFVKIRLSKIYKPAAKRTKKPEKERVKPVKKPVIPQPKEIAAKRPDPQPKPASEPKPKELPRPVAAKKKSGLPEEAVKKEPVSVKREPLSEPELLVKTEKKIEKSKGPVLKPEPEYKVSNDNMTALLKYRQALIALIDKNKYYPKSLKRFKRRGRVDLRFSINSKGELLDVNILRKSRYKQFNRAAKEAVRRVGVFPPPDESMKSNSLFYEVTIIFELVKERI